MGRSFDDILLWTVESGKRVSIRVVLLLPKTEWGEISILVSVGKGHFEDPNIEKYCYYNRIFRNYDVP